jgi:hypothetical protein
MRCTSCNEPTRVLETRRRADGATRRRRECTECGRRFSTEEVPDAAELGLGELPDTSFGAGSGPLEAVRRKAIIDARVDELHRDIREAQERIIRNLEDQLAILKRAEKRHEKEKEKEKA